MIIAIIPLTIPRRGAECAETNLITHYKFSAETQLKLRGRGGLCALAALAAPLRSANVSIQYDFQPAGILTFNF